MSRVFIVDSDLGHFWEIIDSLCFALRCGGHVFTDCLDYKARTELFDFAASLLLAWVGGERDHNCLIAFLLKCIVTHYANRTVFRISSHDSSLNTKVNCYFWMIWLSDEINALGVGSLEERRLLKVHLTPKYFFRLNNSLHLFETHCAFLHLFSPNLDFL